MATATIKIEFSTRDKSSIRFTGSAAYPSATGNTDDVTITTKGAVLKITRSSIGQAPLASHNSTLNRQVIKALCLYYLLVRKPNQIRKISVSTTKGVIQSLDRSSLRQIIGKNADLSVLAQVDENIVPTLLSETPGGRAALSAATHLVRSLDAANAADRFDRLWRAFNALYRAHANQTKDFECLRRLREHIKQNPNEYPLSLARVAPLTTDEIRQKVRWVKMLQNNHPTQKQAEALAESIKRNTDRRILEIYQSTLSVREQHMKAENCYQPALLHIQQHIAANQTCDADVLSTLCIKYMYYVRNKMMHAERTDHGFSYFHGGPEEGEMVWLSPFLESLVIDLLNRSPAF